MEEKAPEPKLEDPSERAAGFAQALVGIIKDQQNRLLVAERTIANLRAGVKQLKENT